MIVKPENMDFSNKNIIMIISGLPGVGKTTLALSAPDVVLIDADEGLSRVKPEHRKDSSMVKTYEELLADIKSFEGRYKTVAIDTCGALIDLMKDWAMRTEPSASKKSGGSCSMPPRIGRETRCFTTLYARGPQKRWSGSLLILALTFISLIGERYMGFTPTMNYNAKSAYGIKGLVKVPELADGQPNDFLLRLFAQVKSNIAAEHAALQPQQEQYDKTMLEGRAVIETIQNPEDVPEATKAIKGLSHALTSERELKATLMERIKELGIAYNKETKAYEWAKKQ